MTTFNFRSVTFVFVCISLLYVLIYWRDQWPRENFKSIEGLVSYIDHKVPEGVTLKSVPKGDHLYLGLSTHHHLFAIPVDKRWNYFNPEFDQLDKLQMGDIVTVYIKDTYNVMYVDKGGENYFRRGNMYRSALLMYLTLCACAVAFCYVLYRKGKMPW